MVYKHEHIDRNMALLAAIERGPTAQDLETAPLLELWQAAVTQSTGIPLLLGCVAGHPLLRDGWIHTSPLMALGTDLGWARTRSRWYRLGSPLNEVEEKFSAHFEAKGPGYHHIPISLSDHAMPVAGERLHRALAEMRGLLEGVIAEGTRVTLSRTDRDGH